MRIAKFGKISPRVWTTVCFTFLLLTLGTAVLAQSQNWWVLQATGAAERGKLAEIKAMKKVYLNVTFDNSGPGQISSATERDDITKSVKDAFKSHKGLTIVSNPALAEFAVVVRTTAAISESEHPANFSVALDPDADISVDVTVLIPGAKLPGGLFKSRSVWQVSSPNIQMEPGAGARFVVDSFLSELEKFQDAK